MASASPPTSPYNPGETLSPSCSPGDANCTVLTPVNSLFNVSTSTISLVAGSNITLASTTNSITISASAGGLSSTTPWTAGNLAQVSSDSVLTSIATSSLGLQNIISFPLAVASTSLGITATGLELSANNIALTAGYEIPKTASTSNWESFYQTPSGRITAGTSLSWAGNTLNATVGGGLSSTTPWTAGNLAQVSSDSVLTSIATSSLGLQNIISFPLAVASTSLGITATGLELSANNIALTAGYEIPKTASTSNWESFYQTPSGRITAGTSLSWAGNTLNATVGGGLSSTTPFSVGYIPYATTTNSLTNSNIFQSGSDVGIGTTTPNNLFQVYDLLSFNNTDFNTQGGYQAGKNLKVGAQYNTFYGYQAGYSTTTGSGADYNTAVGYQSLYSNTTGIYNTANGYASLYSNTTGNDNTANGYRSLYSNTTGYQNTANGVSALYSNTAGIYNTANGSQSLYSNTTGINNTANGFRSLYSNTTGSYNTANGYQSLYFNTTGDYNTANGYWSLVYSKTGSGNVVLGIEAGYGVSGGNVASSTIIGYRAGYALATSSANILLGYQAGDNLSTGSNNIVLGFDIDAPSATSANTLNIGNLIFGTGIDGTGTTLSTGNIGIGTTTPNNLFQVYDLLSFNNTDFNTQGGYQAGKNLKVGAQYNTFYGYQAGYFGTGSTNVADFNTAIGSKALNSNTIGYYNTANGYQSLYSNTTGYSNTANGYQSLNSNTTGYRNTANGSYSLNSNTTGYQNTANGVSALYSNTSGYSNIANGYQSLYYNKTGSGNVVLGIDAGYGVSGGDNVASSTIIGYRAGYALTTGSANILLGYQAGDNLSTGSNNIVLGFDIDAPSATSANTLNIGNLIFGTGINGTGTTLSTGNIGIGTTTPASLLDVAGAVQLRGFSTSASAREPRPPQENPCPSPILLPPPYDSIPPNSRCSRSLLVCERPPGAGGRNRRPSPPASVGSNIPAVPDVAGKRSRVAV